ncbi:MAG: hypothetical protein J0M12_04195 [Deltaproteobacteria bacterium]|nr:hypothetical protein [Deltaproteobacteria bacterium]
MNHALPSSEPPVVPPPHLRLVSGAALAEELDTARGADILTPTRLDPELCNASVPGRTVESGNARPVSSYEGRRELPRVEARNFLLAALEPEMRRWEQSFRAEHGWDAEIALEGSLRVGNFRGAKPSLNPDLNGRLVIDVDLGLRLPDEIDLTDFTVISAVEQVTGSKHWDNFLWDYWGVDFPAGVYFAYTRIPEMMPLVGTDLVELEFVIRQKGGTVAFSDYWERIFTREEILAQIEEKSVAAKSEDKSDYLTVKAQHNADARYRIMFGWHMGTLDGMPAGLRSLLPSWFTWSHRELDGVMPRPPSEKSYPWLRECWDKAERLNHLYKRTGESGEPQRVKE